MATPGRGEVIRQQARDGRSAGGSRKRRPGYILTCSNCRRRKTRCDGGQPACLICRAYHDECTYDKAPPMSQITWMARRLHELEAIIQQLGTSGSEDLRRVLESTAHAPTAGSSNATADTSSIPDLTDLDLDSNGLFSYYGSTSAIEQPFSEDDVSPRDPAPEIESDELRSVLVSNAIDSRKWEDLALGNAAFSIDIPRGYVDQLLKTHWNWIHPVFMFVYRPAFMRDMGSGGKYFSQFLLSVICSHSTRFTQKHLGGVLLSRARLLMCEEIQNDSSITTVQGLLQLSAREIGRGSVSQAWLFSGMAFRMAIHLGLFNISDNTSYTAEDLEIRKRLSWACFCWDKAMSLYLGRLPALPEAPVGEPTLLDDSAETELWEPYYDNELFGQTQTYPPVTSHAVSCFMNNCKLAVIINDIILNLYSRRRPKDIGVFVADTRRRLDLWRSSSPEHLKIDTKSLPSVAPPPHIISQNLLYLTSIILLYRPFRKASSCRDASRQASENAESLLLLYRETFGFARITYLMSYCIYTSATIAVEDLRDGYPRARDRANTFLQALEGARIACPGIQQSIDVIKRNIPLILITDPIMNTGQVYSEVQMDPSMPAFPYYSTPGPSLGEDDASPAGEVYSTVLNSFPEHYLPPGLLDEFFHPAT